MKATREITVLSDIGLDSSSFSYWQGLRLFTWPKPHLSIPSVSKGRNVLHNCGARQ